MGIYTNNRTEPCPECNAAPGEVHIEGCELGASDWPSDGPEPRKLLKTLAKHRSAELAAQRAIREARAALKEAGYSPEALRRATADLGLTPEALAKQDQSYQLARAQMGIPVQMEAFPDSEAA